MKRIAGLMAVGWAVTIAGCTSGQGGRDQKIDQQIAMKGLLMAQLKDPDSAKFDEVRSYKVEQKGDQMTYNFCGTVNAKNGFGGYSGAQRFSGNASIVALEDSTPDFDKIWDAYCTDDEGGQTVWL